MNEEVRTTLMALYRRDGKLTAPAIVSAARPEKSTLHAHFEWDDTVAGERWREVQAGSLVRSCKITVLRPEGEPIVTRAFVHIDPEGDVERTYVPTEEAMADPFHAQLVLERARADLAAIMRRYSGLEQLADILRDALAEIA